MPKTWLMLVAVISFMVPVTAEAAAAAADLDGRIYSGEYGEKGQKAAGPDEFIFNNGKFKAASNEKMGFAETHYSAMNLGDQTLFKAELLNDNEGRINWAGRIVGDEISGIFTLRKPNREPVEYWFKGSLKKT